MLNYQDIIKQNSYINKVSINKPDIHSFNTLIPTINQSQNIKLGICMEKFFTDVIKKFNTDWISSRKITKKGDKEVDHLYINHTTKQVIYCEQKNNINLDTEKSKATVYKIQSITEELKNEYQDYTVNGYLFATRYLDCNELIANNIISKRYTVIQVIGVNNFLSLFNLKPIMNYDEYKSIIFEICKRKFKLCPGIIPNNS